MENRLLIAGFGGQGVMMIGQLLCYTALDCNKEVLFLPHYGPEQRGGTANCSICISDESIGSPRVRKIDVLIAMNDPSLVKFEDRVKPGGTIIVNRSICKKEVTRNDVAVINIPADEIAEEIGAKKIANLVILGAYAKKEGLFNEEELLKSVRKKLGKKPELLLMNEEAVRCGMAYIQNDIRDK